MAYLGEHIPKLGFGLMRPPMLPDGQIDLEQLSRMVDCFLSAGYTYFDTAYGYLEGRSELAARKVLVERYPRASFQLATKLPAGHGCPNAQQARAMLDTSLERTGAGYFDFYLLHNLGGERTKYFDDYGIWDYVAEKKAQGILKHVGFSFHDKADVLERILTDHPEMEFVQLQLNYMDWESPSVQSRLCYETARRHGKPVIIMEPVKGGVLASLPAGPAAILDRGDPGASPASWALRFAAGLEGVITILSGMSSLAQMEENTALFRTIRPLSPAQSDTLQQAKQALAALPSIPCTDCQYCLKGCPQGVAIPSVFSARNLKHIYDNDAQARRKYSFVPAGGKASRCIACGACEAVCPQHIDIIRRLQEAAAYFGE